MRDKIVIAIDAMGGENAPDKTIQGLKFFLLKNDKRDYVNWTNIELILVEN